MSSPMAPEGHPPTSDEAAFLAYLEEQLNLGQYDALRQAMSEQFVLQLYPAGVIANGIDESIFALRFRFVAERDVDIRLGEVVTSDIVPQTVDAVALFSGPQRISSVVASSGWGLAESGVGLLYLTEEEGRLRWAGLVLAREDDDAAPFAPLPERWTAPPAGLVYTVADEWRQIEEQGQDRLLSRYPDRLSLNPSRTLAVSAEIEAQEVILFDFQRELTKTIALEDALILDAMNAPWLDEYTVVIGIAPGPGIVTQATTGTLALLDVRSGAVTPLGPEVSTYAHPTTTGDALIVDSNEGVWLRQGERARFLELDDVQALQPRGSLFSPVLAPDMNQMAGVVVGDFGRHAHGYVVVDLEAGTAHLIHTFLSTPTDARVSWGIRWSQNGEWLALEPPSRDPLEGGVWVVRADGSERYSLGPGTANVVWLEGERLAYTRIVDGVSRAAWMDLDTGEAAWLELPAGARPVATVTGE
ncbi:MAG TPA: hypothetical protein VK879_02720 [Candidatus Sulfomarinibacteraceae bacterium]|nr:hypothetical protein [Candidatus Sulfomarinibacteraceae bacterium]